MDNDKTDPYWRLRPKAATPEDEVCHCQHMVEVILSDRLNCNPLYCVGCNGEIPPERIGFDALLAQEIAYWRALHNSLYLLWLDSGEYELWAVERLSDPLGQVNQ